MHCPPDRKPFRHDEDGTPLPLFVPPAMLDAARAANWRGYWIEPEPGPRPHGRAWNAADTVSA